MTLLIPKIEKQSSILLIVAYLGSFKTQKGSVPSVYASYFY